MDPDEPETKSLAFDGCDSTLYIRKAEAWIRQLGADAGTGIYGMLAGFGMLESNFPKGLCLKTVKCNVHSKCA